MVSNRTRGNNSVGNKLNQLDSRVTQTENKAGVNPNTVSTTQIASDTITNDNIAPGGIQADSIARGAIGTEHLGIVNEINTDSSLVLNIGGATGRVIINGAAYPPPASGTVPLSLDSTGQVVQGINNAYGAPGDVKMIAGSTAQAGWLMCDGSAISRTNFANLFAAIGTAYGAGDGSTTFNVPNLQGKIPVGQNSSDTSFNTLGQTGGEKAHVTTVAEMPSHAHGQDAHNHGVNDPGHGHGISDPGHGHGVNDPGHAHNVYDPGHGHGVYDPGHGHGASSGASGFMLYVAGPVTRGRFKSGTDGGYAFQSNDQSQLIFGGMNSSGTGISINGSGTGIGIYGNGTGIGIYGSGTGVSVNGNTTGVSTQNAQPGIQNTGGGVAHNNLQPYVVMNYVIRY